MIIRRIVENWRESVRMDLRRSVKPYFKGCSFIIHHFVLGQKLI